MTYPEVLPCAIKKPMEQKIITSSSPEGLNEKIKKYIEEGWKPIGSHTAMSLRSQLRYAGKQHMDTVHAAEYAQTMKRTIRIPNNG